METETSVYKNEHHSRPGIFAYTLKTGKWKKLFAPLYYKTLIAEALNKTVCKGELRNTIIGYLISDRRVCLVLKIEHKKIHKMLETFYRMVREEVRKKLETTNQADMKEFLKKERIEFEDIAGNLFTEYELKNQPLIRLITGRKTDLPYYDAELERLKEQVRDYPFCSVIDYLGGESPVLVKLMKKKDWDDLKNLQKEKN